MIGVCAGCHGEKNVRISRQTKQPLCDWCQRKARPLQTCSVCGDERPDVYISRQTGQLTCSKCYKLNGQPRVACSRCTNVRVVACRDAEGQPVCSQCARHAEFMEKCSICGQKRMVSARTDADEPICSLCYQSFTHLVVCAKCRLTKPLGKKLGPDEYLCHACLEQSKKGICPICHHERTLSNRLNGQLVCRMCKWDSQRGICKKCNRERPLVVDGYCGGCYGAVRRQRSAERIQMIVIGMVVYHRKTAQQGRVRGVRTPVNKKGAPDLLRTELMIDLFGKRPEHDLFWPAIHCRSIKHGRRVKTELVPEVPVLEAESPVNDS